MKKRFWIKVYLDLLDDVRMGPLQDYIKWRAIALYLVAGENGNDGLLPPVERLAWRLRLPQEKLAETLSALAQAGVVHETPQGWVVTDFVQSQGPMTVQERVRYSRMRKEDVTIRYKEGNENVTAAADDSSSSSISSSESLINSLEEEDSRVPGTVMVVEEGLANVFRLFEQNIGALTPLIADALRDAEKSDGAEWVCAAIQEAVKNNARSWKYCEAILRRWRRDGFRVDTKTRTNLARSNGQLSPEQLQDWLESHPDTES